MKNIISDQEKLIKLAESLAEDFHYATDKEVLEEAQELYGDAKKVVAGLRSKTSDLVLNARKKRMLEKKKEFVKETKKQKKEKNWSTIPLQELREKFFRTVRSNSSNLPQGFTLAYRDKKENLSEAELISLLEDLEELGCTDPENQE